jgi:hypothetical protein
MDIITDLEKFAKLKMKNEIKGFVDADIWIFKEEIYNGRIAKI